MPWINPNLLNPLNPAYDPPNRNALAPTGSPTLSAPSNLPHGLAENWATMPPQAQSVLAQVFGANGPGNALGNLGGSGLGSADSGHDFGGARGPGPGARGAEDTATHAVDALMGLAMGGFLGPIGGALFGGAIQAANPQATPSLASFIGSLFGGGSTSDQGVGLGGPGGWGSDQGAGANLGAGGTAGGSGSIGPGGDVGGSVGAGVGYAQGGIVQGFAPFAPWQDNKLAPVRSGEAILPVGLTNALGRDNVMNMIRRYRQTGANPIGRSVMMGAPGVRQILGG